MRKLPSPELLHERLAYDAITGVFTWRSLPAKARTRRNVGDVAGSSDGRYVYLFVDGMRFPAHRAAIAMTTGAWPSAEQIDHRDGDGLNNRFANLREASPGMNQQNQRRPQRSNSTGFLGVVPCPNRGSPRKFRAQIWIDGRPRNLGYFLTPEQAHQRYLVVKRELHEGCTL